MLVVKKINAYIGLILAAIAITIAPMLKVPFKGNWNLYQADPRLLYISLAIVALTTLFLFVRALGIFKIMAIVTLIWSAIMAAAVWFKINNYFGSKFFDKALSKTIHFQWGWIVLLVAVILLVTSVKREQLDLK
jgi:ABC-type nickel/cobalt efflux system permease component RcnA